MPSISALQDITKYAKEKKALLIAVSKTKPIADLQIVYDAGQKDFGENRVQELTEKYTLLPKDIRWHMIGNLQTNKIKYIAPFVHLIHSVDSIKLALEIDKQALKNKRTIDILLEIHIAAETNKSGFSESELEGYLNKNTFEQLKHIRICGLMGMATYTDDEEQIRNEFCRLKKFFDKLKADYFKGHPEFCQLSMGMSGDYKIALEEGSTMIRIGSTIFGNR